MLDAVLASKPVQELLRKIVLDTLRSPRVRTSSARPCKKISCPRDQTGRVLQNPFCGTRPLCLKPVERDGAVVPAFSMERMTTS